MTAFVALAGLLLPEAARAANCPELLARGGRIADSYVMDFGSSDKLYVYVMRLPNGSVETCTSYKPLAQR